MGGATLRRVALPGGGPELELAVLPALRFTMGDVLGRSPEADTRPAHPVELDGFAIARTVVTNEQFAWFAARSGYRTTREVAGHRQVWTAYAGPGRERYPVVCVNWVDAAAFAAWAGLRLPTEAEWEGAARGGREGTDYPWGDAHPHEGGVARDLCNWRGAGRKPGLVPLDEHGWGLTPVASYPPNGYGLYDCSGNVWEWVSDAYRPDAYASGPRRNPPGPATDLNGLPCPPLRWRDGDHLDAPRAGFRAIRGGAWDNNVFGLRCCERIAASAGTHNKGLVSGFRVAADAA